VATASVLNARSAAVSAAAVGPGGDELDSHEIVKTETSNVALRKRMGAQPIAACRGPKALLVGSPSTALTKMPPPKSAGPSVRELSVQRCGQLMGRPSFQLRRPGNVDWRQGACAGAGSETCHAERHEQCPYAAPAELAEPTRQALPGQLFLALPGVRLALRIRLLLCGRFHGQKLPSKTASIRACFVMLRSVTNLAGVALARCPQIDPALHM
jgi:hypothetical protein